MHAPQGELSRSRALGEGAHFAGYVIVGLLGSGGLARVYRARHQTLGDEVALKVFDPATAPGASGIARFLREAHLAASLRHPHVVQTLDAGVCEDLPFLVMELLEGRDLEAHLRSERALEELALIELAIPVVAALMALHAQGLVHGDLGPGNVFLVRTPQRPDLPKLLDIGISKPHRRLRLTAAARQQLMGSPLYMAPEAMLGHELTPASDQYSLGLILYECVTGVNPFLATSLKESVRLIISGQRLAVLEQGIAPSPGLADIIERALSVAPADRYPDLAALGRALLRLADQRTRAAWEFSFQAEDTASGKAPSARQAAAAGGVSSRWGAAGVALAVLGWATAGVVALEAAPDADERYVMLGPRPSAAPLEQQRFELRAPPSAATAPPVEATALPCRDIVPGASAASGAPPSLAGEGQTVHRDVGSMLPEPPLVHEEATLLTGTVPEAGQLETGQLEAGQVEAMSPDGSSPETELQPGDSPETDSQPSTPHADLTHEAAAHAPVRGTNNAPIFD